MKKAYPGHAKRVMMGVWCYLRQFMYTKWVIVVDDDIDARDWKDVMWAISTRMDPARDITLIERHADRLPRLRLARERPRLQDRPRRHQQMAAGDPPRLGPADPHGRRGDRDGDREMAAAGVAGDGQADLEVSGRRRTSSSPRPTAKRGEGYREAVARRELPSVRRRAVVAAARRRAGERAVRRSQALSAQASRCAGDLPRRQRVPRRSRPAAGGDHGAWRAAGEGGGGGQCGRLDHGRLGRCAVLRGVQPLAGPARRRRSARRSAGGRPRCTWRACHAGPTSPGRRACAASRSPAPDWRR